MPISARKFGDNTVVDDLPLPIIPLASAAGGYYLALVLTRRRFFK